MLISWNNISALIHANHLPSSFHTRDSLYQQPTHPMFFSLCCQLILNPASNILNGVQVSDDFCLVTRHPIFQERGGPIAGHEELKPAVQQL